ncbi:MAG TPA: hypothetical protein VK400_04450 [Pyrinomonadaceae bacterium]|nr:hypothetical protein [Pyrinomonadaceae bacterium]
MQLKIIQITRILFVLALLPAFAVNVLCQKTGNGRNDARYPNELKGFELMKTSKLSALVPGVSTEQEIKKIAAFHDECKSPYHELTSACRFDENWDVSIIQTGEGDGYGNLSAVMFYPRRRIPFSKIKFSRQFEKSAMGIVHSINASEFISYSDKYGLSYVIVDESGDEKYKKGDLFYIEYGIPEEKKSRR